MAVLTKEDFMSRISNVIGEDNSDESIAFMEDMSDTYNDLASKVTDNVDWKQKYEENDKSWREKYRERFTAPSTEDDNNLGGEDEPSAPKTFDDLFSTKED